MKNLWKLAAGGSRRAIALLVARDGLPAYKTAQLLLNTEMNISEIAAHAGFSGSNYFGDVFLRVYGMSPTEYRQQRKER